MTRSRGYLFCCLLVLTLLCVPRTLRAQDTPTARFKADVRLVEVYATIYDHSGHFVDGLTRDRFQVFENGKPQVISTFETNVASLSCAVLLDTTGSMADSLPRVKNSIVKLIDALGPEDSVAIFTFDQRLVVRQDFTTDKAAAKRAVLRTRAAGETALFDAIAQTSQALSNRPGKKALVVFTDGDDNASVLNAGAAVNRAQKLGIPLYAIAEGEATQSRSLRTILKEMSRSTGGTSFEIKKTAEVEKVFQEIATQLKHMYLLSYTPPSGPDEKWRKIDVSVTGAQDYRIRAKQGYYPN